MQGRHRDSSIAQPSEVLLPPQKNLPFFLIMYTIHISRKIEIIQIFRTSFIFAPVAIFPAGLVFAQKYISRVRVPWVEMKIGTRKFTATGVFYTVLRYMSSLEDC